MAPPKDSSRPAGVPIGPRVRSAILRSCRRLLDCVARPSVAGHPARRNDEGFHRWLVGKQLLGLRRWFSKARRAFRNILPFEGWGVFKRTTATFLEEADAPLFS